jgi:hypothetical protein
MKGGLTEIVAPELCRQLELLSVAREALAQAQAVPEAKHVHDAVSSVADYLRERGDALDAYLDAGELRLRAERRLGDLLAHNIKRGRPLKNSDGSRFLPDDVSWNDSSNWQRMASVPEPKFLEYLAASRDRQRPDRGPGQGPRGGQTTRR